MCVCFFLQRHFLLDFVCILSNLRKNKSICSCNLFQWFQRGEPIGSGSLGRRKAAGQEHRAHRRRLHPLCAEIIPDIRNDSGNEMHFLVNMVPILNRTDI